MESNIEETRYFHQHIDFSDASELEKCLKYFSKDNVSLSFNNFKDLVTCLLTDHQGKSYDVSELMLKELFTTFDRNSDGHIDVSEFSIVWNKFIQPLVKPVTALLIIDVQNDFIEGSLALKKCPAKQDGKEIIPIINDLIVKTKFDVTVYTLDHHPENHISFFENVHSYKLSEKNKICEEIHLFDTVIFEEPVEMSQILWPAHCVQNTWGCELHKDLKHFEDSLLIYKGKNSSVDSYSAFFDNMKISMTDLHQKLKQRNITHVFICGLAYDYCVGFTALDAIELGYATVIMPDATRGTDGNNISIMTEKLKNLNCVFTDSNEIKRLINGEDRKVEFVSIFLKAVKKV